MSTVRINNLLGRSNNLLGETTGVTGKILNPKITQATLEKAAEASNGYIRVPIRRTGFADKELLGGKPLWKVILKDVPEDSISIPLRSKNPDIDLVAKEMLDSKNDMKNFIQSKFYRKLLRKNGINEKEAIQGSEDALDIVNSYLVKQAERDDLDGFANHGYVALNRAANPNAITYLHELTHESALKGTPKRFFVDHTDLLRGNPLLRTIRRLNRSVFDKAGVAPKILMAGKDLSGDFLKYLINPKEIQANLRPVLMLMVERGWQPNLTYRLLESRGLMLKLDPNERLIVKALGEKGLSDVLANMLKKGGKINN